VGAAGSGTSQISVDLIAAHGVTKDMFKQLWLGYNEVSEGIKDGSIDAGFIAGTYPIPALQQLAFEKDIRIVPADPAVLKKVLEANPYFYGDALKPTRTRVSPRTRLFWCSGASLRQLRLLMRTWLIRSRKIFLRSAMN